jgi:hypothetical protein
VHKTRAQWNHDSLHDALKFLKITFKQNCYSDWPICRAFNPAVRTALISDEPDFVTFLSYVGSTFMNIIRVLTQHIKSVSLLPRKIYCFLWLVKDDLRQKTYGVQRIPCECGQVYKGQTGHLIGTRDKKHHQHIHLDHSDKSVLAGHIIYLGHCIQLQDISILSTASTYMDDIIKEATETELHSNIMNWKDGFYLGKS